MCASVKKSREIEKTSLSVKNIAFWRSVELMRIFSWTDILNLFKPLRLFANSSDVRTMMTWHFSSSVRERRRKRKRKRARHSSVPQPLHKSNDRSYDREKSITSTLRAMIVPPITYTPTYDDRIDDTIESLKIVFKATDDSLATKHSGAILYASFQKRIFEFQLILTFFFLNNCLEICKRSLVSNF